MIKLVSFVLLSACDCIISVACGSKTDTAEFWRLEVAYTIWWPVVFCWWGVWKHSSWMILYHGLH